MVKSYVTRIQELEGEMIRLRNSNRLNHGNSANYLDLDDDSAHSGNESFMDSDMQTLETDGMPLPAIVQFKFIGSLRLGRSNVLYTCDINILSMCIYVSSNPTGGYG